MERENLFKNGEDWHFFNQDDFAGRIHSLNDRDFSVSHKQLVKLVPEIVVVSGSMRGTVFRIIHPQMRLGRSVSCDISFDDPSLSRLHCLFELRGNSLYVTDLSSANGTEVNGRQIGSQPCLLRHHDLVYVGDTHLKIVFPSSVLSKSSSASSGSSSSLKSQKKDLFPTVTKIRGYWRAFLSSPWSIKISFLMVLYHGIEGCVRHCLSHGKSLPFISLLLLWLAFGMLKRYSYVRIVLVAVQVLGLIFLWYFIFARSDFAEYSIYFFTTLVYALSLFALLFLPSSNRWFRSDDTLPVSSRDDKT